MWERLPKDEDFLHVRMGTTSQPLCLTLEPAETPPLAQLDPVAASALHRLLTTHRVQHGLPASVSLSAWARVQVTGEASPARALARSLVVNAAVMHSPESLVVAALVGPDAREEWDWLKWLPHALSPRERDAIGPMRLVAESVDELLELLPDDITDRPRFGPTSQPPAPHVLVIVDGARLPRHNPLVTEDGVLGVTVLDLPEQWGELDSTSTLRLAVDASRRGMPSAQVPFEILSLSRGGAKGLADQMSVTEAEAASRRLAPMFVSGEVEVRDALTSSTELVDLLGLGDVRDFDPATAWRPRLQRDRLRVPIGVGCQRPGRRTRHQGVRPAGHGPARARHRRHRLRQVRAPAHPRPRPRDDALVRAAQLRPRRLQGWCDLRRHGRHAARLGRHHQPRSGAHPRRAHAGRAPG